MSTVKTAISLNRSLLEKIDELAGELETSRSRLMSIAAEEFVSKHENRKLLVRLDEAYGDEPSADEHELRRRMRRRHRQQVQGTW